MYDINIIDFLKRDADRCPDKTAVADSVHSLTYGELWENVQRIACRLIETGSGKWHNRPVAVRIDRNIESIEMFLGIVCSGNFYVPVDRTLPEHRMQLIMDTLKPVLVTDGDSDSLAGFTEKGALPKKEEDDICSGRCPSVLEKVYGAHIDTDPLYAIFTSGSTGVPKGVLVNHRSVINLVNAFSGCFAFPEEPVFGNQAPFDFDVSVKDIYLSLFLCGTLEIVPKQFFVMPGSLVPYLNQRKINTVIWAVSALRIAENFRIFEQDRPESLKLVMFSGDVMPVKALLYWQKAVPGAQYVNLYGPTEITCNCTYYIIDREFRDEEALPIGRAFPNTQVFLWDDERKKAVVETAVQGEICVRGTCLACGYYANPDRTAAAFRQDPFQDAYPENVYHTGDIGMYNERGELVFCSRRDNQIKHMGHRIELGEIEVLVSSMPFIDAGCCIYDNDNEKIVLFYQADHECRKEIVEFLSKSLPKYMWPNRYILKEQLPVSSHGKIDRVRLAEEYHEEGK